MSLAEIGQNVAASWRQAACRVRSSHGGHSPLSSHGVSDSGCIGYLLLQGQGPHFCGWERQAFVLSFGGPGTQSR